MTLTAVATALADYLAMWKVPEWRYDVQINVAVTCGKGKYMPIENNSKAALKFQCSLS